MSAINIFSVPQVANLTVAGVNARMHNVTHSAYGRSTFKLFRKVQNDFDFLVRDIDRQPVVLPGALLFHVWDDGGTSLLSLPLTLVNPKRGHYRLTISADDTHAIRSGIYVWSVTNEINAITKLLYTNQDYGSQGILEVSEGVLEPIDDPYTLDPDSMTQLSGELYSSPLPGAMRNNNRTGNHTVLAYLTDFTGRLTIQASVEEQAPTDEAGWVNVDTVLWANQTGVIPVNFQGNFTYVKFSITDAEGFTKLVYRN
jgi:hypothetical protein